MAETAQLVTPEVVKPLKGKYDGRCKPVHGGARINSGRKPNWAKHLSRNSAAKLFKQCEVMETLANMLSSTKDERLRFEIIRYVWDRFEGKPFAAINPDERAKPSTVINDNRLQMAVQQLLPSGKAPKPPRKRVKRLNGASVEIKASPDLPEDVLSDASNAK